MLTHKTLMRLHLRTRGAILEENIIVQNVGITVMMITYIPMMVMYGMVIRRNQYVSYVKIFTNSTFWGRTY